MRKTLDEILNPNRGQHKPEDNKRIDAVKALMAHWNLNFQQANDLNKALMETVGLKKAA